MDQRRDVPASAGWRDVISDWQTERAQLRHQIDQLHKTIDRLHALQPQYRKLLTEAHKNIKSIHILEREANEAQAQALLPELDHWLALEGQRGGSLGP